MYPPADLILAAGGDLGVELRAGVQVVIVGCEPSGAQLLRLLGGQHAQRRAHLRKCSGVCCRAGQPGQTGRAVDMGSAVPSTSPAVTTQQCNLDRSKNASRTSYG